MDGWMGVSKVQKKKKKEKKSKKIFINQWFIRKYIQQHTPTNRKTRRKSSAKWKQNMATENRQTPIHTHFAKPKWNFEKKKLKKNSKFRAI